MSKNIKGFRIKGQVYPVSGGIADSGNITCFEELIPYLIPKQNNTTIRINIQKLMNYLTENFSTSLLTDNTYEFRSCADVFYSEDFVSIYNQESECYVDFSKFGFGTISFEIDSDDPKYNGIIGALQYMLDNNMEIYIDTEKEIIHDILYVQKSPLKLYSYIGYDNSSWYITEFSPISFVELVDLFEEVEVATAL